MTGGPRDLVVIGGGIVGLASALAIQDRAGPGFRLLVIEKEAEVAAHQSGRNSGVIHSGLYYAPGSMKARSCVEGSREMIRFCRDQGVPVAQPGKVIVAREQTEVLSLHLLQRRAEANGLTGVRIIGPRELKEREPLADGISALLVEATAITDYAAVARAMADRIGARGGEVRTGVRLEAVRRLGGESVLETTAGEIRARRIVNCAGLHSDRVARLCGHEPSLRIVPFRGDYLELKGERARSIRGLIYPVADERLPFLGVHLTRTIDGRVLVGPGVMPAFKREGYRRWDFDLRDALDCAAYPGSWRLLGRFPRTALVELGRSFGRRGLLGAARRLIPDLLPEDLAWSDAGVRAQAVDRRGVLVDDFVVAQTPDSVHVLNAPSPAATASLVIGTRVAQMTARW